MKVFFKENKLISVFFVMSIAVIIIYTLIIDNLEIQEQLDVVFNTIFQIAVGFVVSFVFYITQVYIPQSKKNIQICKCISKRIVGLTYHMEEIIEAAMGDYLDNGEALDILGKSDFLYALNHMEFDRILGFEDIVTGEHFTVKKWIKTRIVIIENIVDKLYIVYILYPIFVSRINGANR